MSGGSKLHPLVAAAANGELPDWAVSGTKRRAHMARVSKLLKKWSKARGESAKDIQRWTALGYLHDMMREAKPKDLRKVVSGFPDDVPNAVLHGPAAATRLREEGVSKTRLSSPRWPSTRLEAGTSTTWVGRSIRPTSWNPAGNSARSSVKS